MITVNTKNYIELALRTESRISCSDSVIENKFRMIHACLGLASECAEIEESTTIQNLYEELGDVTWYLAILMNCLGEDTFDNYVPTFICKCPERSMNYYTGYICDKVKRYVFYGKELERDLIIENIKMIICKIIYASNNELVKVLSANILKLVKRYGDKFSSELALNRNLEAEQKVIQQTVENPKETFNQSNPKICI